MLNLKWPCFVGFSWTASSSGEVWGTPSLALSNPDAPLFRADGLSSGSESSLSESGAWLVSLVSEDWDCWTGGLKMGED